MNQVLRHVINCTHDFGEHGEGPLVQLVVTYYKVAAVGWLCYTCVRLAQTVKSWSILT